MKPDSYEAAARKQLLWSPFGKTLRLTAVRSADGVTHRDAEGIGAALASSRGPKFAPACIDEAEAADVCSNWVVPINLSLVTTPG